MTRATTTRRWGLHAGLLALWFVASFGVVFFARDLQFVVAGWPVGFWFAAQGSVLVFIGIKMLLDPHDRPPRWIQVEIPISFSLLLVAAVLIISIILSVLAARYERGHPKKPSPPG